MPQWLVQAGWTKASAATGERLEQESGGGGQHFRGWWT